MKVSFGSNPVGYFHNKTEKKDIDSLISNKSELSDVCSADFAIKSYALSSIFATSQQNIKPEEISELLNKQALNITEEDVQKMFSEIKAIIEEEGISASDSEIKYAMKILTQYANISSFKKVDNLLSEKSKAKYFSTNSCGLSNFMYILDEKKKSFANSNSNSDQSEKYFFADKFSLNSLKESSYSEILRIKPHIVYLTGFDDGINIFNHTSDYSKFIENTANAIIQAKRKNQDKEDFKKTFIETLNDRGRQNALSNGLEIDTFLNPDDGKDAEFSDILNNINLKVPSAKEVDVLVSALTDFITEFQPSLNFDKNVLKSALLKWYFQNLKLYSPKSINEGMKKIYSRVLNSLENENDKEDLILIVPYFHKSYSYMARHFAEANGLKENQIMDFENYFEKLSQDKFNYRESIIRKPTIIVDDISASGDSMLSCLGKIEKRNAIAKCFYTPLVITNSAAKQIREKIKDEELKHQSKLLITDYIDDTILNLTGHYTKEELKTLNLLFNLAPSGISGKGYGKSNTAAIFPVMTPDNDNTLTTLFADRLLLSPSAVKHAYTQETRDYIEKKYKAAME